MIGLELELRNSLFFVADPGIRAEIPIIDGRCWAVTASCLSVATLASVDGPTELVLASSSEIDPPSSELRWSGRVATRRSLVVTDVLAMPVATWAGGEVRNISLYTDDAEQPDRILLVVDGEGAWTAHEPGDGAVSWWQSG